MDDQTYTIVISALTSGLVNLITWYLNRPKDKAGVAALQAETSKMMSDKKLQEDKALSDVQNQFKTMINELMQPGHTPYVKTVATFTSIVDLAVREPTVRNAAFHTLRSYIEGREEGIFKDGISAHFEILNRLVSEDERKLPVILPDTPKEDKPKRPLQERSYLNRHRHLGW